MARKKVKLSYIENASTRKVTFKKRVKGLVKKAQELHILCGVDVSAVVYGRDNQSPVVWPTCEADARCILMGYRGKDDIDQSQWKLDHEAYLKQSIAKSSERLRKLQWRNREVDMGNAMTDLLIGKPIEQVPFDDVWDLTWVIDDKLRTIQHRIHVMEGPGTTANPVMGVPTEMQAGPSQPPHIHHHP